jgi:hypothetical protein
VRRLSGRDELFGCLTLLILFSFGLGCLGLGWGDSGSVEETGMWNGRGLLGSHSQGGFKFVGAPRLTWCWLFSFGWFVFTDSLLTDY